MHGLGCEILRSAEIAGLFVSESAGPWSVHTQPPPILETSEDEQNRTCKNEFNNSATIFNSPYFIECFGY